MRHAPCAVRNPKSEIVVVRSPAAMRALGRRLARELPPGAVVGLDGPLGAGKTVLVRGMVEGLGGDGRLVTSASFVLRRTYPTNPPLIHVDLYRLGGPDEIHEAGLLETIGDPGEAIVAVEWYANLVDERADVRVLIRPTEPGCRRVRIERTP